VLDAYRVLDLTDRRGWLAGLLLAQLGADVVLAEPAGGWPRDLTFEAYNRSKRSVAPTGGELDRLAGWADVVLDSGAWPAADLAAWRAADPALITVRLTPYGEHGPKSGWLATDLTLMAASGAMAVTGDADRPPVRTTVPQAWGHAASDAAVAALVALHERASSGFGQHVDVSAQQSVTLTSLPAGLHAAVGLAPSHRESGGVRVADTHLRWVYPSTDGYVAISVAFGAMIGPFQRRLMEWVHEEGHCDRATLDKDWIEFGGALASGEEPMSELVRILDCISALTSTKTKTELLQGALERRLLIAPVSTMADVLDSPQLAARGSWDVVDGIRHPGPFVAASATPLRRLGAAPAPDADGRSVRATITVPAAVARPAVACVAAPGEPPLRGLKVLDLAWVAAAPLATRLLAYWGATVVRVESSLRPDLTRIALGHRDDIVEVENAMTWQLANAGKLGVALNLGRPEAREVALDLARWADVAIESFTPGTVARWGLGWEDLSAVNPGLVMLSSCVMGQAGPLRNFAGFGNLAASVAGFFDVTGWPDRPPAGPYLAYTDYTSPRFTVCALLAALDHRRRTGAGQYLDFSQMEAATHLLSPALLELQRHGRMISRQGNADPSLVPHGVYPGLGAQAGTGDGGGWIAVVCETDEQWRSLAAEMRRADLAELSATERLARRSEIDELVGAWTSRQDATGLMHRLQALAIPAHEVQNSSQLLADAQLAHRGHFTWVDHPYVRKAVVDTPPQHFSRTPGAYRWAGPTYGQHTYDVLSGILGYDGERIAELAVAEVLE
jgi:crotonobetainyl-CoA:carnitine CoA-transferase CaiB-like acyl-CoA transferase